MSDAPVPAPMTLSLLASRSACGLIDFACHAQEALWRAWDGLGWGWQAVVVLAVLAVILGALRGFLALVRDIAGWPGLAGVVALIVVGIVSLLPKRPVAREPAPEPVRQRRKLPDLFAPRKSRRTYDPTTNTWSDR